MLAQIQKAYGELLQKEGTIEVIYLCLDCHNKLSLEMNKLRNPRLKYASEKTLRLFNKPIVNESFTLLDETTYEKCIASKYHISEVNNASSN